MKATIRINMDNDAFAESWGYELSRILKQLADNVIEETNPDYESNLRDTNGNKVGIFTVTP